MKTFSDFNSKYSLSKTLRFELRPQGKTLENIVKNKFLEYDEQRASDYQQVKKLIDEYHKSIIAESLEGIKLKGLEDFEDVYFKTEKNSQDLKTLENLQISLRKQIVLAFGANDRFKKMFQKELIQQDLPEWLENQADKDLVAKFHRFTTYFNGFHENRKNIYNGDPKASSIGYRMIHENLPKFLDNIKVYRSRILAFEELDFDLCEEQMAEILQGYSISELFTVDFFNETLTQRGIDVYNSVLGGFTKSSGEKVQGVNELINLFRQKHQLKSKDLPALKPLFKQILSDRQSASYLPDQFESDQELVSSISSFCSEVLFLDQLESLPGKIKKSLTKIREANLDQVYFKSGIPLTNLSQNLFTSWSVLPNALDQYYENELNPLGFKKRTIKYDEAKSKWLKSSSFQVSVLQKALNSYAKGVDDLESKQISDFLANANVDDLDLVKKIYDSYKTVQSILTPPGLSVEPKIRKEETGMIKALLDAVMDLIHFIKPLNSSQLESEKDPGFYGEFEPLFNELNEVVTLYNKVRSYLTRKPYSTVKFKLSFENSHFLSGWAADFDTKGGMIFLKDGNYYLGIIDKKFTKEELVLLKQDFGKNPISRIIYDFQKPDNKNIPRLFIRSKGESFSPAVQKYSLPIEEVLEIYDKGLFKTEYRKTNPIEYKRSLIKLIDYFKVGFKSHESYKHYNFSWKPSNEYEDISEFYKDVENSCYELEFENLNFDTLLEFCSKSKIYLFQIYNKDFSSYSKGTPNLHTLYWKALFDPDNLRDVVYKLNGQAEIFFRKKSITYTEEQLRIGHHAEDLKGKFAYPIIKDRRFAFDKFQFHVPITLNFKASGTPNLNLDVLEFLKNNQDIHVIGLDRGERHLLYLTLLDRQGKIKAQYSLNEILSIHDGKEYRTDYHQLLDSKEKGRAEARKNWDTIETIKELKEGYLSQVVHQLAKLIVENNAIVVMEDLNAGFKRGRQKVEKQVYQKFEKMLIDKLNYLVLKDRKSIEPGGVLRAFQLSNRFESFSKMGKQSGIIFYVPAALTSKIDPATGFVNFLNTKYESVEKSKELIAQLDAVSFSRDRERFELNLDYSKIKGARVHEGTRSRWKIVATPHVRYRWNKTLNQGKGSQEPVDVNLELQDLCTRYAIPYAQGQNLIPEMLLQSEKEFFSRFLSLVGCLLSLRHNNGLKGTEERDFILSPVEFAPDQFFHSEQVSTEWPQNADANGAYHIALKGLWVLDQIDQANPDELRKVKLAISNQEWLKFIQGRAKAN